MKWTPNLASLTPLSAPFALTLNRGLIKTLASHGRQIWPYRGARFGLTCPHLPSLSLSLSISVSSDELMDQTYIKAAIPLRGKMAFPSSPSSISSRRVFDPISNAPAMAIPRSSDKAVKGKPQPKSFKELVSRIGQRSQRQH